MADGRRTLLRFVGLLAVVVASIAVGVGAGAVRIPPSGLIAALSGSADGTTRAIVLDLRLPRVLAAVLVGASLAASGATFQALLRNPLAEPYILGVSGGAAVGAVLAIISGTSSVAPWAVPLAAFVGALVAIGVVIGIASQLGGGLNTHVLLLAGVVVGAFFNACILLALTLADAESFRSAIFWMMGSFSGTSWSSVGLFLLYALPSLIVLQALARPLNLMMIGEETAAYLGAHVERVKIVAFLTASLLAAASVALAGVIGFVGLIVPHVVRLAWGSDLRLLLPASMLLGAAFLCLADTLSRVAAAPTELPIGVVTAFVGVPFFVWLLRRRAVR